MGCRYEVLIVALDKPMAAQSILSRLCENLDAAEAE